MTTRKTALWLVLLALASAAGSQEKPAAEKITFRRIYSPGNYVMTQTMNMNQTVTTAQMSQDQQIAQTVVSTLSVSGADRDGNIRMEIGFRRIKQKTTVGTHSISFDSDLPPDQQNSPLAQVFQPMLKLKLAAVVSPDGKVRKVIGFDKMWDEIAKSSPQMGPMLGQLKKQFGDQMVRDLITKSFEMLPTKAMGPGDSWSSVSSLKVPFLGDAKLSYNCKIKAVQKTPAGRVAVIDLTGRLHKDEPAATTIGPATVTIQTMDMNHTGQMRFNADTGMPISQELRQQGKMEMSATGPDGTPVKMSIKQEMTVQSTVKAEGADKAAE